jgi:hypothetical protein
LISSVPQEVARGLLETGMLVCLRDERREAEYAARRYKLATGSFLTALTKIAPRTAKVLKNLKTGGRIPAPDDEALRRVAGEPYQ